MTVSHLVAMLTLLAMLGGCFVSPPHVSKISDGTYWLTFPKDAVTPPSWKNDKEAVLHYMQNNQLIPFECQRGAEIIGDVTSTHAQVSVRFRCLP